MAKNKCVVYLGYEDEYVNEKNHSLIDFTTNKVGGNPDWPYAGLSIPSCPLCGLKRFLLAQIYAPLDNSEFHRTLYIFTCLNPICSNQSQSWLCVRSQCMDKASEKDGGFQKIAANLTNYEWCSGADEWGDDMMIADPMSQSDIDNSNNEENGNLIENDNGRLSDDDESNSQENDSLFPMLENLRIDDTNANLGANQNVGGAVGQVNPSAEIEGEESEVVTIETPVAPQRDLIALLKQTTAVPGNIEKLTLRSFFMAVDEERAISANYVNEHVLDLIQLYQAKDEMVTGSPVTPENIGGAMVDKNGGGGGGGGDQEQYEKENPAHGDLMFHYFITKIQENPGQILRYSRQSPPLLIRNITEPIKKCTHCRGDVICEVQILPTIIPKLRLENNEPIPIEFGNVLVFTCAKSCWDTPDKIRFENVIVQQEI